VIPFNVGNYLYGLTSVQFWPYLFATWIATMPGTLMYVYLGALGREGIQSSTGETGPFERILFVGGLLATVTVTIMVTRIARRAITVLDSKPGEGEGSLYFDQ
jgi:uncharacterized membrane protein YdjX (TVP38/TMEM64 family)